jgi:hypothetical protein
VPLLPVCAVGLQRVGNDCLPLIPPPSTCRDGQVLSDGHCCPPGLTWNGLRCGSVVGQCPPGMRGQPPRCFWVDPPKHCPPGSVGQWPNCRRVIVEKCPAGMVGSPPNCKRLTPTACPAGSVGRPPNCRAVQVPLLRRTFTPGKAVIPGNAPPRLMTRLRR